MACLEENTAALFMQGGLAPEHVRAVEAHLDGCARCGTLLAEVARIYVSTAQSTSAQSGTRAIARAHSSGYPPPTLPSQPPPHPSQPPPPGVVGRYQLAELLGAGGMGIVFAAFDPILQRRVALKLVRPDLASGPGGGIDPVQAQLVREAQAVARVAHPHVVAVFDVGFIGSHVFFAMELVEGPTLRRWLAMAPRSAREIVAVMVQVGRGLEAIHAAGLVHCDVKPDNVIVGVDGRARITDLGLAAALRAPGGALGGTPAYLAPERVSGWPASPASDQWSFAATMFEALHGVRPSNAASWREIRKALAAQPDPTRQSSWSVPSAGRAVADVPGWLDAVLRRGLEPLPASRFVTMGDICVALEHGESRGGPAHVRASVVVQLLVWMLTATFVVFATINAMAGPSSTSASPASSAPASAPLETHEVAAVLVAIAAVAWLPVTLLWVPINAYGLWRRRAWSRSSTLLYGVFTTLGCVAAPVGLYLVFAMTRSSVRAELDR